MGGTLLNSSYSVSVNLRATSSGKGNSLCKVFNSSGKEGGKANIRRGRADEDSEDVETEDEDDTVVLSLANDESGPSV